MTTVTTTGSPKAWGLDVLGVKPEDVIPEALILSITSKAGFVEGDAPAVRVPAIRIDQDEIGFVPEGADIEEADPVLAELVLHTGKIAHLIKVSREQVAQPEALTTIINGQKRALIAKADWAMLQTPAPVAPASYPPAGLLAHASDAGPIGDNLDALVDAQTMVTSLPGGVATHIIASPESYSYVRKLKRGTGSNESLVGAGVEAGVPMLLGVPVLTTSAMPENKIAVIDRNQILSAYGEVLVARSDDFYFDSDNVALRCTFRFGVGLLDAQVVQVLTLPED